MTTISIRKIKTPTTVKEFQNNLRRYLVRRGGSDRIMIQNGMSIAVEDIKSFDDIRRIAGWDAAVIPSVSYSMDEAIEYICKDPLRMRLEGFFKSKKRCEIYDLFHGQGEFMKGAKQAAWHPLDNQIIREFFIKAFGKFSGYAD